MTTPHFQNFFSVCILIDITHEIRFERTILFTLFFQNFSVSEKNLIVRLSLLAHFENVFFIRVAAAGGLAGWLALAQLALA